MNTVLFSSVRVRALLLMLGLFISAHVAVAQPGVPEYGSLAEIQNSKTVYVVSNDYDARESILRVIEKDSDLKVVGKPEDAEFVIVYGSSYVETGFASIFNVVTRIGADIGDFVVAKGGDALIDGSRRPRILWAGKKSGSGSSPFVKVKSPAEQLCGKFLKALQRSRRASQVK